MFKLRYLLPILVGATIMVTLFLPVSAQAHANVVRSEPQNNTVLAEAPGEARIWFGEPISAEFSAAQLLDIHSQPIPLESIRRDENDATLLILGLPELLEGVYSIRWNVLSEADWHFTRGLIVFGVGSGTNMSGAATVSEGQSIPPVETALRWVNFAALASLTGALFVAALVLNRKPAVSYANLQKLIAQIQRRVMVWAALCAGFAFLVGAGLLAWQAASLQATLPQGVSLASVAGQLLIRTQWGTLWLARQTILLALTPIILWVKRPPVLLQFTYLALCIALLSFQATSGHAAALTPNTWLAVFADVLHLLAASLWVGGLLALNVGTLPLLRRASRQADSVVARQLAQAAWGNFGGYAALSVGILAVTGLYSLGRQVASLDAFISTLYGLLLAGKLGLILLVGAIGLTNSMLLHPRVAAPLARLLARPAGWTPLSSQRLPALVLAESGLGLIIFLAVGAITSTPPARGPEFAPPSTGQIGSITQEVDDLLITFSAQPNQPGENLFTVRQVSTRRPAPAEVLRVILRFTFQEQDLGETSVDAALFEEGVYQVGGNYLSMAGRWQVEVAVRRKGIEDSVAVYDWEVGAASAATRPLLLSNQPWEPGLSMAAGALLVIVLALAIGGWVSTRRYVEIHRE